MGENTHGENGKVKIVISIAKQLRSEIRAYFEPNLIYRPYEPKVLGNKLKER